MQIFYHSHNMIVPNFIVESTWCGQCDWHFSVGGRGKKMIIGSILRAFLLIALNESMRSNSSAESDQSSRRQ